MNTSFTLVSPVRGHESWEEMMQLVTHKKVKGGHLMPWGKGTVVSGAKGYVFRQHGNQRRLPALKKGGGAVGDAAAQWRSILANIKSDLEELGTSLDHLIRLTFYVKGPFPHRWGPEFAQLPSGRDGRILSQHCPKHCSYNNPPPSEVIGVAALAHPDLVIDLVAVAALPD